MLERLRLFLGTSIILDFSQENVKVIELNALKQYEEKIKKAEFVIIKTGWDKYWGTDNYYNDFPFLSEESAQWLAQFHFKGIGIDAISIDGSHSSVFMVHKILLPQNILIIENLTNLDAISGEYFLLSIMPLKTRNADGSPVRAIGIEDL